MAGRTQAHRGRTWRLHTERLHCTAELHEWDHPEPEPADTLWTLPHRSVSVSATGLWGNAYFVCAIFSQEMNQTEVDKHRIFILETRACVPSKTESFLKNLNLLYY